MEETKQNSETKKTSKSFFKSVFKPKYRIIADTYAGYEVQVRKWYSPFYFQIGFTNTHITIEKATEFAKQHANKIYLDI